MAWAHLSELGPEQQLCLAGMCGPMTATSATEPTNPFGWSDLAETLAAGGEIAEARKAFAHSVRMGPNVPPILIRVVNFEVGNGQLELARPHIRHILELTSAYDNLLFRYVFRSGLGGKRILAEVIPDPGRG